MNFERSSGILIHLSSLPSAHGIGDMGREAYKFVDFLATAGQRYWQLLPLSPTRHESGNSPYSSPSAFAGNVLVISPDELIREGYLSEKQIPHHPTFSESKVDFKNVIDYKVELLETAFKGWKKHKPQKAYYQFCKIHQHWLDDYAIYMALRAWHGNSSWATWPEDLRRRKPAALKEAADELADQVKKEKFLQFVFYQQWIRLRDYAHKKGIQLIGDVPFYVNYDSADCWSHPDLFKLDENLQPESVSGVPPDFFSETGQLWGTPVFDWAALQNEDYQWWVQRLRQNLNLFDIVRLDHFRAFSEFWEIPAGEKTAVNGKWTSTPGKDFLKHLQKVFPSMPFIAEDLGIIDKPVYELRDNFELPGMLVLQFAFGDDVGENIFAPHNHTPNSIVYTGTHDNNTLKGWYDDAPREVRRNLCRYLGRRVTQKTVAELLHRTALQSVARLAIIPIQDILGLGSEAIMNIPGTSEDNWDWRLKQGLLSEALARRLNHLNQVYGRIA